MILLIPIIALGIVAFYVSLNIVRDQTLEQDRQQLVQISNNIDGVIDHMKSTTLIAYSSSLLQQYIKEEDTSSLEIIGDININNYLYSLRSANYEHYTFILNSYNSDVVYCNNYDYVVKQDYPFEKLSWVTDLQDANGTTIFVPTYKPDYFQLNSDPVFSIARQINDNYTLLPLGYIIINCDIELLDQVILPTNKEIYVFDNKDHLIYPANNKSLPDFDLSDDQVQKIDGKKYLVTIYESPKSQLIYVALTPNNQINQNSTLIIQMTLLTVLITILLSFVVSFPLSRGISKPIGSLRQHMASFNEDTYTKSIVDTNIEEIYELNNHFNEMMVSIDTHIQEEYKAKILKQDTEFKLLQSQVNPHFLFNTLESIRMMAVLNDDDETAKMIINLANLYRYSIRTTDTLVPLHREIDHINNYIKIQQMRFPDKFQLITHIDLQAEDCEIPQLIVQPLVENCIAHGLKSIYKGGLIEITAKKIGPTLKLTISDNGRGIEDERLKEIREDIKQGHHQGHIGLLATFQRIKRHFETSYLTIDSYAGEGTLITITINYEG